MSDYGLYITNAGVYSPPERDVEHVEIPGKDGKLEFDNERYRNVTVTYPCIIYKDFENNYTGLTSFLLSKRGYRRIEDSFYPDYFRIGSYYTPFSTTVPWDAEIGKFDIEFDCKPQRWLKIGEETYTIMENGLLFNPTLFTAKPMIRMYGIGTVKINDKQITVSNLLGNSYADIDCELMQAYSGNVSLNKYASGDFPVLAEGENIITTTATIDITPRWWVL